MRDMFNYNIDKGEVSLSIYCAEVEIDSQVPCV